MATQTLILKNGKTEQILNVGQPNTIKARAGDHYRIVKGKKGEEQRLDNVIAKRSGEDLQLQYADGTQVTIENYYAECKGAAACEITLPGQDAGGYAINAEGATGTALGDSSTLVYVHGNHDVLMGMAQGNTILHTMLAGIEGSEMTYVPAASNAGNLGLLGALAGGLGLAGAAGGGAGAWVEASVGVL